MSCLESEQSSSLTAPGNRIVEEVFIMVRRDGYAYMVIVLLVLCALCFIPGCGRKTEPEEVIAKVNDYSMSVEDLVDEIEHSPYIGEEGKDLERLFDLAVRRQVLIQEAQRQGLDRQKSFMKTIERYWEQTLIRELLKKKMREILQTVSEEKQDEMLEAWLEELYESSEIEINRQLLDELKKEYK